MKSINPEIAEILGVFIGDGWIESDKNGMYITGNPTEDKDHYDKFLAPLFSKHFTIVKPKEFHYWKVYGFGIYKKDIINKAIELGFPVGKKCLNVKIPFYIFNSKNKKVIKALLRGIFDSDGSFWCEKSNAKTSTDFKKNHNCHPEFSISSCSKKLLIQIKFLLNKLDIYSQVIQKSKSGFRWNRNINNSYALTIRRIRDIEKWFEIIGTNNPKHKTRYELWKKLGYLPPKTTIIQRKEILKNL